MTKSVPTKGNLLALKKQLALAKLGYELLDRKRNIMMREMLQLAGDAGRLQEDTNAAFREAYYALQRANFSSGQNAVKAAANMLPLREGITILTKSVMGIEISELREEEFVPAPTYGVLNTDSYIDKAYLKFNRARRLAAKQAAVENSVYKLAFAIKQSQKRANALKNIIIPKLTEEITYIADYLEEKEREQFFSMKLIKNRLK